MKNYELDLRIGKDGRREYITQTQRKYFKLALDWCLKNNWNNCKVNRTYFNFDFDKLEVNIKTIGYINTYKMKEV